MSYGFDYKYQAKTDGGGSGVDPTSISGLRLYFDPTLSSSINGGSPSPDDPISSIQDLSAYDNDGSQATGVNQPLWKTDYMDFDGNNDSLEADGIVSDMASATVGTISFWLNPNDATPGASQYPLAFSADAVNESLFWWIDASSRRFTVACRDAGVNQWILHTDNAVLLDGQWSFLTLKHNGTEASLYVDGELADSNFSTSTDKTKFFNDLTSLSNCRLGCVDINGSGDTGHFACKIQQLTVYNTELSDDQIAGIYNWKQPA